MDKLHILFEDIEYSQIVDILIAVMQVTDRLFVQLHSITVAHKLLKWEKARTDLSYTNF